MRMKLHHDTFGGDYELYQVYDLGDISKFTALSGYTLEQSSDNVTPNANKYRQFRVINNTLRNYTPKMPISSQDANSILKANLRYNRVVNNVYMYDEQTMNSFSAVEQGVKPADWVGNPHYLRLMQDSQGFNNSPYGGYSSVNVIVPVFENSNHDEWSGSYSYYYDDGEKFLKRFVTDTGYTFTVMVSGFYNSNRWRTNCYNIAGFNYTNVDSYKKKYNYTRDNNSIISKNYNIDRAYCITGSWVVDGDFDFNAWGNSPNCVLIFVHFTDSGQDFYGIGMVQYDNYTDTCIPIAIDISAYDSQWWGSSIISGGESGQGSWGDISIPNISGGTFSRRSDNVSRDGTDTNSVTALVTGINTSITSIYHNGLFTIYKLTNAELYKVFGILFGTDFWQNWTNKYMNPLSFVLSLGFIPEDFLNEVLPSSKQMTLGGYNISNAIADAGGGTLTFPVYDTVAMVQFAAIDMEVYFDGYADFAPYTTAILHLPFIGSLKLDVNKIAHGKLGVEYACDLASGNVIAYVWMQDYEGKSQYIASANGNCMYNLPLYSSAQDGSAIGKIIVGSATTLAGILTQNPGLAIGGGVSTVNSALEYENATYDRTISESGTLGGNNSLISTRQVWLEITRPNWIENMHYQLLNGIPAEMSNCIADCGQVNNAGVPYDGYIVISEIELDNVNCTDSERSEIAALLQAGVFIRGDELLE